MYISGVRPAAQCYVSRLQKVRLDMERIRQHCVHETPLQDLAGARVAYPENASDRGDLGFFPFVNELGALLADGRPNQSEVFG